MASKISVMLRFAGQVEAEDFSDKAADKAKEVNENVDKATEKVADKADDVK